MSEFVLSSKRKESICRKYLEPEGFGVLRSGETVYLTEETPALRQVSENLMIFHHSASVICSLDSGDTIHGLRWQKKTRDNEVKKQQFLDAIDYNQEQKRIAVDEASSELREEFRNMIKMKNTFFMGGR